LNSRTFILAGLVLLLVACAGEEKPDAVSDGPPDRPLKPDQVQDAVPRPESRAAYGNKSVYEVWGKTYTVMDSAEGYRKTGTASWYGSKFHGRRTSSGEPYDMYKATAAHRNLPLPTYAEVTNLDNGRKVIVKINDRGPFHSERIIDLSYAAAVKIGIADQGTGRVEVRAITFGDQQEGKRAADYPLSSGTWLQAGAFSRKSTAEDLARGLERGKVEPVIVERSGGLYKVFIGPFRSNANLASMAGRVVELGYERPHTVSR
jgi:rare lipoprotein A